MQVGAGYSAGLRWLAIDIVLESCILTGAVINIEPRQFLEDAREIVLERMQIVIQKQYRSKHCV